MGDTMNVRTVVTFVSVAIVLFSGIIIASSDVSAEEQQFDREIYCYGDHPTFRHPHPQDVVVEWSAVGYDANGDEIQLEIQIDDTDSSMTMSLEDVTSAVVTQTVKDAVDPSIVDVETMMIHAMHIGDEEYTVTFWDGGEVVDVQVIDNSTIVEVPNDFVSVPLLEADDGYYFAGWFVDQDFSEYFDPSQVVTGDMDIYAKWNSTEPIIHTIVVNDTHTVVFESVHGLRCDVTFVGGTTVRFTVNVCDGFSFDLSSITVRSDGGRLSMEGDEYVLSGIDRDITVSIRGDSLFDVRYSTSHASISIDGYQTLPESTISGPFEATVSSDFGWTGMDITVIMDGRDITSECVDGNRISIDNVSGDLVISAESTFPWIYVVIIAIVIIAVIGFVYYYRKKSQRD